MRSLRWLVVSALTGSAVLASACGGSSSSLATVLSPTNANTITGLSLALNPPGVGATSPANATVSLSNGNNVVIVGTYTSDTQSVATVSNTGVVTGVSIGDATITAEYQGFKASKKIRVLPNYAGRFDGSFTLDTCTDVGGYAGANSCASILPTYPLGTAFSFVLGNAQSADLTSISGQFLFAGLLGDSNGTVSSTGVLTYAGSIVSTGTWRMDFQNFVGGSPSVAHINGRFQAVFTDSASSGSSVWSCTIVDLVRAQ